MAANMYNGVNFTHMSEELNTLVSEMNTSQSLSDFNKPQLTIQQIMDNIQLAITVIGFLANISTFITLSLNGKAFSHGILLLLRHQSILDGIACGSAAILLVQPYNWIPGVFIIDAILCYCWNSQAIYWSTLWLSIWNLVFLAFERYLAVCRPFMHQNLTSRKLHLMIAGLYGVSPLFIIGSFLQTRYEGGECLSKYFMDGKAVDAFFYYFSISNLFTYYTIPCSLFVILYGLVIFSFQSRQKNTELGASRVIDRATSELTKTAIIVTIIFIIALSYECWYYMLGYTKVVPYVKNSPLQKVGILLASFNSFANPFVYGLLVPAFRESLRMTFCRCCTKSNK